MARITQAPHAHDVQHELVESLKRVEEALLKSSIIPEIKHLIRTHKAIIDEGNAAEFTDRFLQCALRMMVHNRMGSNVENLNYFYSHYLALLSEEDGDEYREEIGNFINKVLEFYCNGLESKLKLVRKRVMRLIRDALTSEAVEVMLTDEVSAKLMKKVLERGSDVDSTVRKYAYDCLREVLSAESAPHVIKLFTSMVAYDPSAEDRGRALSLLRGTTTAEQDPDISSITIMDSPEQFVELAIGRVRDPGVSTRVIAYEILLDPRITLEFIDKINEAHKDDEHELPDHILNRLLRGLSDHSKRVRNAAFDMVVMWLKSVDDNMLTFLQYLHVVDDDSGHSHYLSYPKEDLMKHLFSRPEIAENNLNGFLTMEITPEQAFYMRTFMQYCTEGKLHGLIDKYLPTLYELAQFIDEYWEENLYRQPDADEAPLEINYIFGQLLMTASFYDVDDQASMNRLANILERALVCPWCSEANYDLLMKILKKECGQDDEYEFVERGLANIGLITSSISDEQRFEAELRIVKGILENTNNVRDPDHFEKLAEPTFRCFSSKLLPNDIVSLAVDIYGLLALSSSINAETMMTFLIQRYKQKAQAAAQKQLELNEEIEDLELEIENLRPNKRRTLLIEELKEKRETKPMPETWDERRKILEIITDVMLKHAFIHDASIDVLISEIDSNDLELQSLCVESICKLLFCDFWNNDEVLEKLVLLYIQHFNAPRGQRRCESYNIVISVVEMLEHFFGLYHHSDAHALNLGRVFPRVLFDWLEGRIEDIARRQLRAIKMADPDSDGDSDDENGNENEHVDLEYIEAIFKLFREVLRKFIHWTNPNSSGHAQPGFPSHSFVIRQVLVELDQIAGKVSGEAAEFKSLGRTSTQGQKGPAGKNEKFYKVWLTFSNILVSKLRSELKLETSNLLSDDLVEMIDIIENICSGSVYANTAVALLNKISNTLQERVTMLEAQQEEELAKEAADELNEEESELAVAQIDMGPPTTEELQHIGNQDEMKPISASSPIIDSDNEIPSISEDFDELRPHKRLLADSTPKDPRKRLNLA